MSNRVLIDPAILTEIADAIRAKDGSSGAITPANMADAVGAITTGGAAITDGIVIKARDANGYATEVDFYGTIVQPQQFYNRVATDGPWKNLQTVNFKNTLTTISNFGFKDCLALVFAQGQLDSMTTIGQYGLQSNGSTVLDLPSLTSVGQFAFISMTNLATVSLPKLTNCNVSGFLRGCSALQTVTLGSVGYAVTAMSNLAFQSDTQTGLTITVYTTGDRADTIVTNIRNSATAATIVIKAAEATAYNGTSYAPGDTILTSEVAS